MSSWRWAGGPRSTWENGSGHWALLESEDVAAGCGRIENLISPVGCPHSSQKLGIETDAGVLQIVNQVNAQRLTNNTDANPAAKT